LFCNFLFCLTGDAREAVKKGVDEINFPNMQKNCTAATAHQIQTEITASVKYLTMAAYFSRDSVNRPGFAKMFYEAASEEREHAHKLIEYLAMRGKYANEPAETILRAFDIAGLITDAEGLFKDLRLTNLETTSENSKGLAALKNALKMEQAVTEKIRKLIKYCEDDKDERSAEFNHYHVSCFLLE